MGLKQVVDQLTGDVSYVDDGTDTPTFSPMLTPGEFVAADPLQWQADWRKHQEQVANNQADAANSGGGGGLGSSTFAPPKTTMPGLQTGTVMPGTQPQDVMPGYGASAYGGQKPMPSGKMSVTEAARYAANPPGYLLDKYNPIGKFSGGMVNALGAGVDSFKQGNGFLSGYGQSLRDQFGNYVGDIAGDAAKSVGFMRPAISGAQDLLFGEQKPTFADRAKALQEWETNVRNSANPLYTPYQNNSGGVTDTGGVTPTTNGFVPGSTPSISGNQNPIAWQEQQAEKQTGTRPGLYDELTVQMVKDAEKAKGAPLTEQDLNEMVDKVQKAKFAQPSGSGVTYGGANNNYFRDIVLSNPTAADSDAAYEAALRGGFKGTMNDWRITKDAILHNANRGNSGFSGYSGGNGSNAATTTPTTTETSGFSPSTWTPRPWQSDKGILKFDEQDWSTIPNEVRPFVDSLLRAKGWTPTGQYGLYGAIEYKYGGNAPSNIWFDSATFDGLPDNVKQYLQNLFAQKGWTTTPTATTTTTTA